ncbi:hypothetical protein CTI14_65550, partial [Methylobacterium radiotolerans]
MDRTAEPVRRAVRPGAEPAGSVRGSPGAGPAHRMRNRGAITEAIQTRTRQHTSAHWIERLNRFGVPCGQVLNLQEVFEDPQVQDQR